jgi:regulator of protease activity HflC (stomatin/prohibitin superfamily)
MRFEPDKVRADDASGGTALLAVVKMLKWLFFGLRILIVLVVFGVAFQGVFYVREHEEAMLFRFGLLTSKAGTDGTPNYILRSGDLYWAWPYPIDVVKRIPARRPVVVETSHFWPAVTPATLQGAQEMGPGTGLKPGQDGYLLTGDANIVHTRWSATYRITDARRYYLNFYEASADAAGAAGNGSAASAAEDIIRSCLENAVLKEVATWSVQDVIKLSRTTEDSGDLGEATDESPAGRAYLTERVERRLREMVAEIDVGVEIQSVNLLTSIQPPLPVRSAFQEVLNAAQEYERDRLEAETFRERRVNEALAEAAGIRAEARAYAKRVVAEVQADRGYFLKVLEEYEKNPRTMLVGLYTDTIRDVLQQAAVRYIVHEREDGRQEIRLLLGPESPLQPAADQDKTEDGN